MKVGMPFETLRVRDVMTRAVVFLNADFSVDAAWDAFYRHSVNGAPVLGQGGRLVGMLTTSDLADPRRRTSEPSTVEDVMTKMVYAVRADDPVLDAVRLMTDEQIHRALVVNADGTIAGIVSPMDVLRALRRLSDPDRGREPHVRFVDLRRTLPDRRALPTDPTVDAQGDDLERERRAGARAGRFGPDRA